MSHSKQWEAQSMTPTFIELDFFRELLGDLEDALQELDEDWTHLRELLR